MAEINVNKKSVGDYLKSGVKHKFLVPDYQRPYSWTEDEVSTLWDDIKEFFEDDKNKNSDYFCGTVVTYKNEKNENEIIDGQQRTISLLLLLRAIYTTLEQNDKDDVTRIKNEIEKCLWETDRISGKPNRQNVLINSKVATDEHNEEFIAILKDGNPNNNDNNYSKNYKLFEEKIDEYTHDNPTNWRDLCADILDKVILLPIECEDQDTALTIFSTLNDRGMLLSDADIFKAKIYNHLSGEERDEFIENWKYLEERTEQSGIDVQALFIYYMWTLRGRERDIKPLISLRKYFAKDGYKYLYDPKTIDEIKKLSDLWTIIYNRIELTEYKFSTNIKIKKIFDILLQYPNEYWKYVVSTYFLHHYEKPDFENIFLKFLKKLTAYLVARHCIKPTLNAVRNNLFYLNVDIIKQENPYMHTDFTADNKEKLEEAILKQIRMRHKATRPLLYMSAYNNKNQQELLPKKIEVEHILPRRWTNTNLFGFNRNEVELKIESLGNKIVIDKKTNIQAGNRSFFEKKEKYYKNSKIAVVNELSHIEKEDFTPEDIDHRNEVLKDELMEIFKKWELFDEKKINDSPTNEEL